MPLNSHSILSSTDQPAEESLIDRRREMPGRLREMLELLGAFRTNPQPDSVQLIRVYGGRYLDLPLDDWAEAS